MKRISVLVTVLIVMSVLLSACGGSSSAGGASAAAKSFFDAFAQLDFTKMKNLTCAAQQSSIDTMTNALGASGSTDQLKQMLQIDASGLTYTEKSASGNTTVVVSGKLKMTVAGQSQDQDINNEEIPMANEGGQWKICGSALPTQP